MTEHAHPQQAEVATGRRHGRAQYVWVFALLGALTLVELGLASTSGISRPAQLVAFVAIALAKAALIALFYMHLRFETRILRATVLAPLLAPAVYGIILIAEVKARFP
jgi:cytochrome c oxidase subunit IV